MFSGTRPATPGARSSRLITQSFALRPVPVYTRSLERELADIERVTQLLQVPGSSY